MFRLRTSTAAAFTLVLAGAGTSCDASGPRETIPPTIILITLDTVRADNLGVYGAPAGATPTLDGLSASADRYESCVSAAPWTMPTHASLFTGLMPFEHGAHTFLPGEGHKGDNVFALHGRFETLAEALGARGYRTGGVIANAVYLRPGLGLEQGFLDWDVHRTPAAKVTERALQWLDDNDAAERPAFLFVNYMDAHRPYATGDRSDQPAEKLDGLIDAVMLDGKSADGLASDVRGLHQKAVTRLDAELAALFEGLKARGMYEGSMIVLTSDHGEAFGAHGIVEHSKDVYEDLVRVPLIVKHPGQVEGAVLGTRASSVHVPGLIARALAGTEAASLRGVFPRTPGGAVMSMNYYSRTRDLERFGDRFKRKRTALYSGNLKLIAGSDESVELYDLAVDPRETTNLAESRPNDLARMIGELNAALASSDAFEGERAVPGALSPQQAQDMRWLGY